MHAVDGPVLINVWATWCEPCRREMASLERLHRGLGGSGIRIIGVSVDRDVNLAREYVRGQGLTFPNLSDPDQALVRDRLAVTKLPTTVAIGSDGRVRWREVGARDWDGPPLRDRVLQSLAGEKN
jgi:cytochrome c biogenesis protein CcmG, thiol:disulfide interchange protein DsbE